MTVKDEVTQTEHSESGTLDLDEVLADSHENILPTKTLIIVFSGLALSLFLAFVDQTGITVALPYIAKELDAQDTISWAGTSFLISSTTFVVIWGRLSDIFSRKYMLILSLIVLGVFDIACGAAKTSTQIFVFRGFCGVGVGGITSLTMMIVSDVVTLENRGKYQGILGACVGLGNAIGPFLASAFITHTSWRKFYYMIGPVVLSCSVVILWLVPYTHTESSTKEKLLQIDYLGWITSSIAITFTLIPISGGGSSFEWNSALVISMITIGCVFLIVFIYLEVKCVKLPMISMHLFTQDISLTILLCQNFFFGLAYYSIVYYVPYYFETVRGNTALKASVYMIALVIPQFLTSIISGQVISRSGKYLPVVWFGYTSWTLGVCLISLWGVSSNTPTSVWVLILMGMGIGATFQPTMVAAQAHAYKKDRSIVISTRNFLRSFGGAIGLAISPMIIGNIFKRLLKQETDVFTASEIEFYSKKIFLIDTLQSLPVEKAKVLRELYVKSLKNVFYLWMSCLAFCLISTVFIRDHGLAHAESTKSKESEKPSII